MRAVNLIPAEQRGGAPVGIGRSEGAAYAVLGVLGGLAVLALLYGSARNQISSRRTEVATVTAQAQRAQAQAGQLAPYTSFVALHEQRMQAVSQLVDTRFDWAHAFHELGRVLPAEISISSLSGTVGAAGANTASAPAKAATGASAGGAVTSATPPGSVPLVSLVGCATSQPAVALMLNRLRLMDGAGEVTLQTSTKTAAAGGGGSSSGGCPPGDVSFTVQVAFAALPVPSASTATAPAPATTPTAPVTTPTAAAGSGTTSTGAAR